MRTYEKCDPPNHGTPTTQGSFVTRLPARAADPAELEAERVGSLVASRGAPFGQLPAGASESSRADRPDPWNNRLFEPYLGHDFGRIRIHHDSPADRRAEEHNAVAFTLGNDITFARGAYAPHTLAGRSLLAHELVHAIQNGAVERTRDPGPSMSVTQTARGGPQRVTRYDVLDWSARKQGPPVLTNGPTGREILVPPTGQIQISALVQVNGGPGDNCTGHEVGTTQTAWVAWTVAHYEGQTPRDGSVTLSHRPAMPMRDPGTGGTAWYDPAIVRTPGVCGDAVGIFHLDSPWHEIPKARHNGAAAGNPLNYLRSYTRGLHLVAYLTVRRPDGTFLPRPLRFVYWNSLQDFEFTPNFLTPFHMWAYTGQIRTNIGAKGTALAADAPYYTTPGPEFNADFNQTANWAVAARA